MRDLFENELKFVSGAGSSPTPPSGSGCSRRPLARAQGNNGFAMAPTPERRCARQFRQTGGGKAAASAIRAAHAKLRFLGRPLRGGVGRALPGERVQQLEFAGAPGE
jgi:hypothetical protein